MIVAEPEPAWRILVAQGKSLVVLLLVVASVLALAFGDLLDAVAIAAVLVLNSSIGFWIEVFVAQVVKWARSSAASSA